MFAKLKNYRQLLLNAVVLAPVEVVACVIFFLAAVCDYYTFSTVDDWILSFPACFNLIYIVNLLTRSTKVRWIYFCSVLFVLGFWLWQLPPDDTRFWITLLISQLLVGVSVREKGDTAFLENVLCYVRDLSGALLLAFLSWFLAWTIYISVVYIFDLDSRRSQFVAYSAQVAFLLMAPLIFLMFNTRPDRRFVVNSFFRILVNFIISPALLAYNLILYAYFAKIALLWSLPKGGVAYMVLSFVLVLTISKAVQGLLQRRYYDWYYNYFSWWILPAVVVLWISTFYRIGEYGLTEGRVYLMLMALVVTVTMFSFFYVRWRKYKGLVIFVTGVLVLFTYIPGINAKALGVWSQEKRIENVIRFVYPAKKWTADTSSLTLQRYEILYNSSLYIEENKGGNYLEERFGYTRSELDENMPEQCMRRNSRAWEKRNVVFLSYDEDQSFPVAGFDSLQMIDYYQKNNNLSYESKGNRLILFRGSDTLMDLDLNPEVRRRLAGNGVDTLDRATREQLEGMKSALQVYNNGNIRIILENIRIDVDALSVESVMPRFLLKRKEE